LILSFFLSFFLREYLAVFLSLLLCCGVVVVVSRPVWYYKRHTRAPQSGGRKAKVAEKSPKKHKST
jgi:hypothetical protein